MPRNPHPSWQRRHEAVLLWMIRNPGGKVYECAEATGYSRWQVSRIINSPDFQQRFQKALDMALKEGVARWLESIRRE